MAASAPGSKHKDDANAIVNTCVTKPTHYPKLIKLELRTKDKGVDLFCARLLPYLEIIAKKLSIFIKYNLFGGNY